MDRKAYIRVKTENGEFDVVYPITNTDNIEIVDDKNGTLTEKLRNLDYSIDSKISISKMGIADGIATLGPDGLIPIAQIPMESRELRVVENIEQMYAIEPKFESLSVFVKDATGDPSVKSGGAFYIYDGNKFVKTAQSDTMNVITDFVNILNKPTTLEGYGITDAVHRSEIVPYANPKNAGKIVEINKYGELDASITGRSNSTARLDIPRRITLKGDVTGSFMFDGGANVDVDVSLISRGIKPGTYTKFIVDDKGRIIGVSKLLPSDIPNVDWSKIVGKPTNLNEYGITDQVMVRDKDQEMSGRLILGNMPADDMEATPKTYVDAMILNGVESANIGKSAITVAVENINLIGLQEISGVTVKSGDRVLVKGQNNRKENGVYIASENAWVRSNDLNQDKHFKNNVIIIIKSGKYSGRRFALISINITLGSSDIEFIELTGSDDVIAGSGLTRSGNMLSLEAIGSPGTYLRVTIDKHGRVIAAQKFITESDIQGGVSWNNINDKPASPIGDIDEAVASRHIHRNQPVLDKLSENAEGNLLYNGKQIATGPSSGGGGGGTIEGSLTCVGPRPSPDLAVGGLWFNTVVPEDI